MKKTYQRWITINIQPFYYNFNDGRQKLKKKKDKVKNPLIEVS
jgi:hypothetical protein